MGFVIGVFLIAGVATIVWQARRAIWPQAETTPAPDFQEAARFVGSEACASCHAAQMEAWRASRHAHAMQHANAETVLGDFDQATFRYAGVQSTFYRRDGRFFVRTDGADGDLSEFEILYTFGLHPLQQYLIPFPDGRLQALSIAWDSRPEEQGGQRWFHLYPGENVTHADELHWTRRAQNWNYMCADCHATALRKNYDANEGRYSTEWSELGVGCEACHGPSSGHLAWASGDRSDGDPQKGLLVTLDERAGVRWQSDPETGTVERSRPRGSDKEIQVCAQCHSRRAQYAEGYVAGKPFLDYYQPALLDGGLYYVDGQQRDEVYKWGSFLQSRMYHGGVTCSDCHDPHTQQLRASGNGLCTQCHEAARYDGASHHFHREAGTGAACVSCHMPVTQYMVIDPRHEHSIRVPRPDESVRLGVPNACTTCHADRDAKWAAEAVRGWYGRDARGMQQFATTLYEAESGGIGAGSALARLARDKGQPDIARATATSWLGAHPSQEGIEALRQGLVESSPLIRAAALDALEPLAPGDRAALATPLLTDPVRAVRIAAARMIAPAAAGFDGVTRDEFERAASEFIAAEHYRADRPEHRTNLGNFFAELGHPDQAAAEFRAAIEMEPSFVPAYVNYADMLRTQGDEAAATRMLQEGLRAAPEAASLHHALGLALIRQKETDRAVAELKRAAGLEPSSARYAYVYGVALHSNGDASEAIRVIEDALRRHPHDHDLLTALAMFRRDAGNLEAARHAAERLVEAFPSDPVGRGLLVELGAGDVR
jgi:predicted CXXCH cytochrome family protein